MNAAAWIAFENVVARVRARAGTGHRGRNFLADEAGFPHAGYNDFALALIEDIDGSAKALIEARRQILHRARFDFQDAFPLLHAGIKWDSAGGSLGLLAL